MKHPALTRLAGGGAALLATVLIAACGSDPVQPVSGQSGGASSAPASSYVPTPPAASGTTTPTTPTTPTRPTKPTRPPTSPTKRPPSPSPTSACLGAVVYTISGDPSDQYPKSLCMKIGGVLRIEHVAPGTVSADPAGSVTREYEAGVYTVRFIRTGTVTVQVALDSGTRTTAVVVVS
ncbi:hypothetical protein ODJ79_45400 [Actinoplanes sp. KI2]|uniref:hypothetical protein n=1 Tax=Actinoplanes sp. KI2 TaxID=2983315 RepID=UPI0021D5B3CB|nr:hypothetical protein [Actinoplanes sp. KI2]MCU7730996.1 hypothetical protein [Actinoplanes sp. KI2]